MSLCRHDDGGPRRDELLHQPVQPNERASTMRKGHGGLVRRQAREGGSGSALRSSWVAGQSTRLATKALGTPPSSSWSLNTPGSHDLLDDFNFFPPYNSKTLK